MVAVVGLVAIAFVVGVAALTGRDEPDPSAAVAEPAPASALEPVPTRTQPTATTPATTAALPDLPDLPDRGAHPELRRIDGWLQSEVTSLEELRGQVVAVQFWTFGCSNCKATLPHMQALYDAYHDQGLEIVGIHAPEFSFEAEVDNIVEAADELGVTWPIVLDTDKRTFHHWQEGDRAFWPRIYLLDRDGHVRYDHIGEGRYDEIDAAVRALLAEPA